MSTPEPPDNSPTADSPDASHSASEPGRDIGLAKRAELQRERDGSSLRIPMRLAGSGMELASYTLLLGAAGYWIDGQRQHAQPYIGVAGALVGFTLGMYRLIVLATRQR